MLKVHPRTMEAPRGADPTTNADACRTSPVRPKTYGSTVIAEPPTYTGPDGPWTLLQTERATYVVDPTGKRHALPQALSWLAAEAPDAVAGLGLAAPDLDCHDCHDVWA